MTTNPGKTQLTAIGRQRRLLIVCLAATALAAGCYIPPVAPPTPEGQIGPNLYNTKAATLINEGGPVFALPGELRMPVYFRGEKQDLVVRAERLEGGPFAKVAPASVAPDGRFVLSVPENGTLFFATTEFTQDDGVYRMRALAQASRGRTIIVDTAGTLVGAKIALAAQKRPLSDLNALQTASLIEQVSNTLQPALDRVQLNQSDEDLSETLTALTLPDRDLAYHLLAWEQNLVRHAVPWPLPSPTASPTAPPSMEPAVEQPVDPVK